MQMQLAVVVAPDRAADLHTKRPPCDPFPTTPLNLHFHLLGQIVGGDCL